MASMPRKPDPFKPDEGAVYTNGQVNRAGQLLRRFYAQPAVEKGEDAFTGFDVDELVDAMIAVTWWRSLHARPLSRVAANLRYHVAAEDAAVEGRIDVTQRLKRRPTIFNKLEREPTMELTQMWDIGGVRARVPSLGHLQAVSRRLKKTWTIVRTKDYIDEPRSSGYRAVHHIVRRDRRLIEVQLRTVLQDAWANQVEEDSRRLATGYKFGGGGEEVHDYYRIVSEAFAALDRDEDLSPDLVAAINENYANVAETLQRRPPRGDR
jgi:ppGpp synthetase/RelA/SpoT-type nucleotidyltranferase